jgi:nicotinate-nucleotide--dimethylbenzimidazole phosphoribosyltransferase
MTIAAALQQKIDNKTKPLGALGKLENLALQIGVLQNTTTPSINNPQIVVFAADHGIASTGDVNPFPQAVTAQMVLNFVQGGAAINVFCQQNNIGLTVVDAGVNFEFDAALPILHEKIKPGTQDYRYHKALHENTLPICLEKGGAIVQILFNKGCNTIGFGEMGIGNTSSAALIMHYYTGLPLAECVGAGTGANPEQLKTKLNALQIAAAKHNLDGPQTPNEILERFGGYEIAMMAGAYLQAHKLGMLIVVDGFIATAALMCAIAILNQPTQPNKDLNTNSPLLQNCVFAHCSNEQGHTKMLQHLRVTPLLNLGLRLGEGTGAALAIPIIKNAVAFLNHMASFETAGVSNKE